MADVTIVTWVFAPDWLTVDEAARLAGLPVDLVRALAGAGFVEAKTGAAGPLVHKQAWHEYLQTLREVRANEH